MNEALESRLNRLQQLFLVLGLVVLGLTVIGAFSNRAQFFFSYLFGCLFWLGLSLGCFLVTMIHQLAGGRWGYPTRRFLEAGFLVLPLMLASSPFLPEYVDLHSALDRLPGDLELDGAMPSQMVVATGPDG